MAKHDLRQYLKIEGALTRRLQRAWRPHFAAIYRAMLADVKEGDFAAAYDKAGTIDFTHVANSTSEYVRFSLHNAAAFGARCATNGDVTAIDLGDHTALLKKVSKVVALTLKHNVTRQVHEAAVRAVKAAELHAAKATKAETAKRFVRGFVSFKDDGDQMLQMTSALHTSRLAVWGFTAEAQVRGITTYRLEAVLDGRTSKFCQFINGKEFQVEDARTFIVKALSAGSPDDLKSLHPWPHQDLESMAEYKAMSTDELRSRGYFVPPFHPHCRTLCVPVGASYAGQTGALDEAPAADFSPTTASEFEQLKLPLEEGDLEHWQKVAGDSPAAVLSKLSGAKGTDILDGKVDTGVKFNEDGSIGLTTKTKDTNLNAVLDPFDGTLYLNHAEFEDMAPKKAAATLKGVLTRAGKMASDKGYSLNVTTSGSTAYTLATAGFVPTAAGWKALQAFAAKKLPTIALPGDQSAAVKLVLASNNPEAVWALAALPYDVDGMLIGEWLMDRAEIEMMLDPDSPQAGSLFQEWSGE